MHLISLSPRRKAQVAGHYRGGWNRWRTEEGDKERESVDRVERVVRAFGISGNWRSLVLLQEGEWFSMPCVAEGGRVDVHGRVEEEGRTSVWNAPGEEVCMEAAKERCCCARSCRRMSRRGVCVAPCRG